MEHKDSFHNTSSPVPCVSGCGFYGTPENLNMCSKCYREHLKREQRDQEAESLLASAPASTPPTSSTLAPAPDTAFKPAVFNSSASVAAVPTLVQEAKADTVAPLLAEAQKSLDATAADGTSEEAEQRKLQKNPGKCFSCKKKIGLTGFKCRCGFTFCAEHRYSDKHDCPFDYKTQAKQQIAKANPVVAAAKLKKI